MQLPRKVEPKKVRDFWVLKSAQNHNKISSSLNQFLKYEIAVRHVPEYAEPY